MQFINEWFSILGLEPSGKTIKIDTKHYKNYKYMHTHQVLMTHIVLIAITTIIAIHIRPCNERKIRGLGKKEPWSPCLMTGTGVSTNKNRLSNPQIQYIEFTLFLVFVSLLCVCCVCLHCSNECVCLFLFSRPNMLEFSETGYI